MKKYYYLIVLLLISFSCSDKDNGLPEKQENNWTVEFDSNGGSLVAPIENVLNGTKIQRPTDPEKPNHTFEGWFTDNTRFSNEWLFDKRTVVANIILYAKWASDSKWTVSFDSNGGSQVASFEDVKDGTTIYPPTNPVKDKYKFDGWYSDNTTFGNKWDFVKNKIVSDTILYAKWVPESEKMYNNLTGLVSDCADPYILNYNNMYYLYGTGGNDGIKVYQSSDMVSWSAAVGATNGYALHKSNVWGEKWFWAPEVYLVNGKFYMFYSAEEKISVAESASPLGPFVQAAENKKPFHESTKEIDTHLFIDDDGKKYLFFVRFTNGNEIWGAELNDDLRSIKENTLKHCLGTTQNWEKSTKEPYPGSKVIEGPFMLKRNGWYYLTYSANHYMNPNYGVGYATSKSPLGPWTKYNGNPVLIGNNQIQGVGHHSFVTLSEGCQYIVYHSHYSMTSVQPRKLAIDPYEFIPSGTSSPDILKVYGPTTGPQRLCSEE